MSLLTPAHMDCSSWMCFVGAWGCSAASKGRENHFTGLIFHKAGAQIPPTGNQQSCHNFLQIYRRDFPIPPQCLEHQCVLPQGIPTLSVECVVCSQPPDTLGRAQFLGLQLLLQKGWGDQCHIWVTHGWSIFPSNTSQQRKFTVPLQRQQSCDASISFSCGT